MFKAKSFNENLKRTPTCTESFHQAGKFKGVWIDIFSLIGSKCCFKCFWARVQRNLINTYGQTAAPVPNED